jgi:hypothetical protein
MVPGPQLVRPELRFRVANGTRVEMQLLAYEKQSIYTGYMSAQTLGFAVQPDDRPLLDELVAYFGEGNRSAYLRATLEVMKSVMLAEQLRELQAYGQQRTARLGIDPGQVPARIQEFLKSEARHADK